MPKADLKKIEKIYEIPEFISAPQEANTAIGKIIYKLGDKKIGEAEVYITEKLEKMSFADIFIALIGKIFSI